MLTKKQNTELPTERKNLHSDSFAINPLFLEIKLGMMFYV